MNLCSYDVLSLAEARRTIKERSARATYAGLEQEIAYLAGHPKAGDIMEGTGGVRKLRWRRGGQGKSGGVRVIYYYHDELMPLYLLTLFAKGDKVNLTKSERNELAGLVDVLVNIWKGREKS